MSIKDYFLHTRYACYTVLGLVVITKNTVVIIMSGLQYVRVYG